MKKKAQHEAKNPKDLNITDIDIGTNATITEINGTNRFISKLSTMGITQGAVIKKVSASFLHGSIVVEKDMSQIALSYDIAKKITVKIK